MYPKPKSAWPSAAKLLALACLILLPSCSNAPQENITQTMQHREEGFNRKDIELYMSAFSPAYNDGEKTYADIKAEAEENFQVFKRLEYKTMARSIYLDGSQARVVQKYVFSFQTPNAKKTVKGDEAFLVKNESQGWKIVSKLTSAKPQK